MTKQSIIVLAVVTLIVLIGGFFVVTKLSKPTPAPLAEIANSTPAPTENPMLKTSLKSLLGLGKNVTCSYQEASVSGTVFVADKKMRSDNTILDSKGISLDSHVLSDGEYTYMWTGTQGSKIKISAIETKASPSTKQATTTQNLDQELNMKCDTWTIDPSKFVIPSDVKFTDISSMMTNIKSSSAPALNKSVCDSITDPTSKASCIKALSGNN